jgi:hypothetical protein
MSQNLRPTRHLDITQFYNHYQKDIENLYSLVYNNLTNKGVYIENDDVFYNDFIKYIYKFSIKYKSNYDP